MFRVIAVLVVALAVVQRARAAPSKILYASDWPGPTQLFAIDPSHRTAAKQLTFAHITCPPPGPPVACGFAYPVPSPDGRHVAYRDLGSSSAIHLAAADGRSARVLGRTAAF